ncbi:MAG: cupin domain-containing protein [Deltaproteobacteria bacterium]|nr:cupin domain-containing protein [Deltaproteobacteria bacterium]
MTPAFSPLALVDDQVVQIDGLIVRTWAGAEATLAGGSVFACVDRPTRVTSDGDVFTLRAGMWLVAPDEVVVAGGRGLAIIVPGWRGLRQIGGPLEPTGRLRYIDGCSDTVLVAPPRRGDPCLNHLHIPAGTLQSTHTHPSVRIGIIARGDGACVTPDGRHALAPGTGWIIPAGLRHAFHTAGSSLDVIAWHPDTDVGPIDEDHPMLNRTFVV